LRCALGGDTPEKELSHALHNVRAILDHSCIFPRNGGSGGQRIFRIRVPTEVTDEDRRMRLHQTQNAASF
jgi:hypothetical protein